MTRGHAPTEYQRERIRESNRNRVWSDESKNKLRNQVFTEDRINKLRDARYKQKNLNLIGMKGKKHTKESLSKISKAMKGRVFTDEHRKKISLSRIGRFTGKNSPMWKGGITAINTEVRNNFKYRQWRSDVFYRDNYCCVLCLSKKEIQVDHIKPMSVILHENNIVNIDLALNCEELWNINNGRTLCLLCHKKTDTFAGKATKLKNNINKSHA